MCYFNPRPRKEGDDVAQVLNASWDISIHALVKRATVVLTPAEMIAIISIHALVKRATAVHAVTA